MGKVSLRMNELSKYEIIKKLVETCGNKKRAALKLSCTIRTINRRLGTYRNNAKEDFVPDNRSIKPTTAFSQESKDKIIELYTSEYVNANIDHDTPSLIRKKVHASYQITCQILTKHGIPAKILTDRRTVLEYKRKNAPSDEEEPFTQYSYACKQLGIE